MKHAVMLLTVPLLVVACTRDIAVDQHPELVGSWYFHPSPGQENYIHIREDGTGYISFDDYNGHYVDSKDRKIYLYDNKIFIGKGRKKAKTDGLTVFHLDQYPTKATQTYTTGNDTVTPQKSTIVIDGQLYLRND